MKPPSARERKREAQYRNAPKCAYCAYFVKGPEEPPRNKCLRLMTYVKTVDICKYWLLVKKQEDKP